MTTDQVKIARINKRAQDNQQLLDLVKGFGSGVKDLGLAALGNPAISIILAAVLVEYLQTVKIKTGNMLEVSQPGTHAKITVPETKQLISDAFGTTIETVVISSAALNSVATAAQGLLPGIAGLLGAGTK